LGPGLFESIYKAVLSVISVLSVARNLRWVLPKCCPV